MLSLRKLFFFGIALLAIFLSSNQGFGATRDQEETFKVYKLSSNAERVTTSVEGDFHATFTDADRRFYLNIEEWHASSLQELKSLDSQINAPGDKTGYRNLCSLQISVVYKAREDGELKKRDISFDDVVFLSGRDNSKIKPQSFSVGQVDLRNHPFKLNLEPVGKDCSLPRLPSLETALSEATHSHQSNSLPLRLEKRFISLDDFYLPPQTFEYEKHIIEYFGFESVVDRVGKDEVKRAFRASFKSTLQQNPFLDSNKLSEEGVASLDKALLVLPFNENSSRKARHYFGQSADELFARFKSNFCDSEQAIRLFIGKRENKALWRELAFDEDGNQIDVRKIDQLYVSIASVRYMCSICQGTYFYDIKEKRDMMHSILLSILSAQLDSEQKSMESLKQVALDSLKMTVYASGIKPPAKDS